MLGSLLGVGGAFGTGEFDILKRTGFWIVGLLFGSAIALLANNILERIAVLEERPIAYHILLLILICPAIDIVIVGLISIIFGANFDWHNIISRLPVVFIISVFMTVIHWVISQIPMQSHGLVGETATKADVLLYERLPFKFKKAKILAINAEDHYLRIHTDVGDTMILMRLYDAIKELEGIEGSQIHRSWWVAKDAIQEIVRGDGRVNFRLSNGELAPISRSFQNALKAQNWL